MKPNAYAEPKRFLCVRCEYEFAVLHVGKHEAPACPKCLDSEWVERN